MIAICYFPHTDTLLSRGRSSCSWQDFPPHCSFFLLNLFLPSQYANTPDILTASYSHIWCSCPLLQKAGLFIYLLKRWQQLPVPGRDAPVPEGAMWSGLGASSNPLLPPLKLEWLFFIFLSIDLLLYMPRESYISIAFLDPSPVLLLFLPNWVTVLSYPLFPSA